MSTDHKKTAQTRGSYKDGYDSDDVTAALNELVSNDHLKRGASIRSIAKKHGIPEATLRRYRSQSLDAIAKSPQNSNKHDIIQATVKQATAPGTTTLLTPATEQQLADWIDASALLVKPPTVHAIRHKAMRLYYSLNHIPITDENRDTVMSRTWWRGFCSRHPHLRIHKTAPLDIRRVRATQPEIIDHFFELLKSLYDKYGFKRDAVWALDETGVAGDIKPGKCVGPKGTNQTTPSTKKVRK